MHRSRINNMNLMLMFSELLLLISTKIEKEQKQLARDAGFTKTEITGAEVFLAGHHV